jgi:hypothetical protein
MEDEMGRAYSMNGGNRTSYRLLVGKPEEKIPLEIPRFRWVDNIMIDLRTSWNDKDGIGLAQDRIQWRSVNTIMNFQFP